MGLPFVDEGLKFKKLKVEKNETESKAERDSSEMKEGQEMKLLYRKEVRGKRDEHRPERDCEAPWSRERQEHTSYSGLSDRTMLQ